jgi:HSP20 family molecular chaperone IbpA
MALVKPYSALSSDYWDLWDFHRELGLLDDYYYKDMPLSRRYFGSRLWKEDLASTLTNDKDWFRIRVGCPTYKPEEVTVKVSDDGWVTVNGKHEDYTNTAGFVSRDFTRKYLLPKQVDADRVYCTMSPSGLLTINCPKKYRDWGWTRKHTTAERALPISYVGLESPSAIRKLRTPSPLPA